ncbi:hypothetical protein AB5J62_13465 [Amycolatopsis sp. cg5]|uniref:hypothetical protein n=1 Tax=Amycolatopsis sp. cg5 TaxID=3238802 RepID=UPI00352461C6
MSLEYEAWCAEEPDLSRVARVTTLIMRSVFMLGEHETRCTLEERDSARFDWGDSVFCLVSKTGPDFAEDPRCWTLFAESGSRGEEVHELLSLAVVVSAGVAHDGVVVDETGRLANRKIRPMDLIGRVTRAEAPSAGELLRQLRSQVRTGGPGD